MEKYILGGPNYRGGSLNLAMVASFSKAVDLAYDNLDSILDKIEENKNYFIKQIKDIKEIKINIVSPTSVVSIYVDTLLQGESIVNVLQEEGIYLSTKSACSKQRNLASPALEAIGLSKEEEGKTLRISFSYLVKKEDIDFLVTRLNKLVKRC